MKLIGMQSIRPIIIILALFVCNALFSATVFAKDTIAMITDLTGKAAITGNGEQKAGEILMSMSSGDEIHVDSDSKLTLVYFESAIEYSFPENSVIHISAEEPLNKSSSKIAVRDLEISNATGLMPVSDNYRQAALVLRGGFENKPGIKLIRPVRGKVLDTQPTFEWLPIDKDIPHRFRLSDSSGQTLLATTVYGSSFKLPLSHQIEKGEIYSWQMEAQGSTSKIYSTPAKFSLIEDKDRETIEKMRPKNDSSFSKRVIFALMLEQLGVYGEANRYWKVLSVDRPNNQILQMKAQNKR